MKTYFIPFMMALVMGASCGEPANHTAAAASPKEQPDSTVVSLTALQIKNASIVSGIATEKEMHKTLRVSGTIDVPPQNIVSISLPLGGYLKSMNLIPGQQVKKGSVLATFEDQQYIQLQQDYLTAKSKLEFSEADYNRQKGLNESKSASDKVLQLAKSDWQSQKILVNALAEKLRLVRIEPSMLNESNISRVVRLYAPISGYITKVNFNIGKYVAPTDVLFELINPADLHLSLTVFENDAQNLAPGQKVSFTVNNRPDKKYLASIHLVTPNISDDRATEVHCDIDGEKTKLLPGTFVNAAIELDNSKVVALPEGAVVKWENKDYVFSEESANRFRILPVEVGNANDGYVEIRSQLPERKFVLENAYTLLMKMKNGGEE